jgi:hypothetical protein
LCVLAFGVPDYPYPAPSATLPAEKTDLTSARLSNQNQADNLIGEASAWVMALMGFGGLAAGAILRQRRARLSAL